MEAALMQSPTLCWRRLRAVSGRRLFPGRSEADWLADEDEVDAARQLLVDLEDLSDVAVLPVGGLRAGILELEAVLVDPFARRLEGGDDFLGAGDQDDVGGAPGVGGELAAGGRRDHQGSVTGDRLDAAQSVAGLAAD